LEETPARRSRRANGQGSIYFDQARQIYRCAVTMPDGKRRTFSGKTREEVEQKLADGQYQVRHHQPLPARDRTVASFMEDWIEGQREFLRPRTWTSYAGYVRNHIVPSIGRIKLADLEPEDVERLHRECRKRGLSPRSVRYCHTILGAALKQADRRRQVSRNVAALAPPPKSVRPKVHPFDPQEAQRFLEEIRGDQHECLYTVTLGLGLRRGEVLGLRWSDIDFGKRQIRVAGQLQRVAGALVWQPPKTDDSIALLDCPQFVIDALQAHRDRLAFSRRPAESDYVFVGAHGGPLDPDGLTHTFGRFLVQHGLRKTRFHDLRHATASLLLSRGVPMWQVSKLLRHGGITITSDTYSHLYPETSRAAANVMNDFMSQAVAK
jgi:integrase